MNQLSEEVRNITLKNGETYSGYVEYRGTEAIPNGVGICKYNDHKEYGVFRHGSLDGIAYLNYYDWMMIGMCRDNRISGWGMKVDGDPLFGVFENNELKVDVTRLVRAFLSKVNEISGRLNKNLVQLLKTETIFLGVPASSLGKRCGFFFMGNGEVFLGACDDGCLDITGCFLHFDLDYNIRRGRFVKGKLLTQIDDDVYLRECSLSVGLEYYGFDVSMNYSPASFLLDKKKLMHIFEVGKTNTNLIVKASICHIRGAEVSFKASNPKDTTWFFFPLDNRIEAQVRLITENREGLWAPDFSDYRVEFVNNIRNSGSKHLVVYKHVSCWDKNADYNLDIYDEINIFDINPDSADNLIMDKGDNPSPYLEMEVLIPNYQDKREQLVDQWKSKGWYIFYPSIREYVSSLGEDDDVENFFGWLFDDASFNGCRVWHLPLDHKKAFALFLQLFPTDD